MPKTYGTAGPRLIMPTICTSVPLAGCSIEAQLLFERLITQADDQGRLQGEARVVAALCMPLVKVATERSVRRWLGELETAGLILRYLADGRELIQLAGWWDNQGTPRRAYPSRYPAPDGWADRVRVDPSLPPSRGQSADNPPRNDGESPRNDGADTADRGQPADIPPLAGAPARVQPNPTHPITQPTPTPGKERDAAVALFERWGRFPTTGLTDWLGRLAEAHGEDRVMATIDATPRAGEKRPGDYLKVVEDKLRAEDHAAEVAGKEAERRRVAAARLAPLPPRIQDSPEYRSTLADLSRVAEVAS